MDNNPFSWPHWSMKTSYFFIFYCFKGGLQTVEKNQTFDDVTWWPTVWQSLQISFLLRDS